MNRSPGLNMNRSPGLNMNRSRVVMKEHILSPIMEAIYSW